MSWSSVGHVGVGVSTANNQSSLSIGGAAAPLIGDVLVLLLAVDNAVTVDGADDCITSISDQAGNVWQRAGSFANAQGATQAGATIDVWWCQITVQYSVGVSVVLNYSNATLRDASAATMWQFRVAANSGVKPRARAVLADSGIDPGVLDATTLDTEMLRIRAIAGETSSNVALTPTNGWTVFTAARSGTGTSTTEMGVRGEFIISSGTGAASDPSYASADQASFYLALQEIPEQLPDDLTLEPIGYIDDAFATVDWNKTMFVDAKAFLDAIRPRTIVPSAFAKALKQMRLNA